MSFRPLPICPEDAVLSKKCASSFLLTGTGNAQTDAPASIVHRTLTLNEYSLNKCIFSYAASQISAVGYLALTFICCILYLVPGCDAIICGQSVVLSVTCPVHCLYISFYYKHKHKITFGNH